MYSRWRINLVGEPRDSHRLARRRRRERPARWRLSEARSAGGASDAPRSKGRLALALDIGGTKLAAGVVDESGRVHSFLVEAEPPRGRAGARARAVVRARPERRRESGVSWDGIDRVGIGSGGPLDDERGILIGPPHLPGWVDVPVIALAGGGVRQAGRARERRDGRRGREHRYGAGVGTANMDLPDDLDRRRRGRLIDGRLSPGTMGNGGELGHVTVDWQGRECRGCGRRGCLEGVRLRDVDRRACARGARGLPRRIRPRRLRRADRRRRRRRGAGDAVAGAVWDETTAALACGLTSLVNLFEPQLVVLGGGVTRSGEQLLAPVRDLVRRDAMGPAGNAAEIVVSALGDRVGVVGAAAIAFDRVGSALEGR